MADPETVVNFNGINNFQTIIWDTESLPEERWQELQLTHRESLRSQVPQDEWDRVDAITLMNDPARYRDSRVNPNVLVGKEWSDDQLFRKPIIAVTFDKSGSAIGAVLTADNTSASLLPKSLRPLEYWAKMLTPQSLEIPKVGHKRRVHLREAFVHPDAQTPIETDKAQPVISAITLRGLYYSLMQRQESQRVAAYVLPNDSADTEFAVLTSFVDMHPEPPEERPHAFPGYVPESKLVRVENGLSDIMHKIFAATDGTSTLDPRNVRRMGK